MPFYISAQVAGSTMAAGTLRLLFNGPDDVFTGTAPQGSNLQAFVIEFIITFYLMFVVSGVATDKRAVSSSIPFFLYLMDESDLVALNSKLSEPQLIPTQKP